MLVNSPSHNNNEIPNIDREFQNNDQMPDLSKDESVADIRMFESTCALSI